MSVDESLNAPWTRKHDLPSVPLIPSAPRIVYPTSLEQLIDLCRRPRPNGEHLTAAGSHWALSGAAISDGTFIETHDPAGTHQVMGRTLLDVVPGCLHHEVLDSMGPDRSPESRGTLVHVEAGKRIYQLYSELDQVDDLGSDTTLAGFINKNYGNDSYRGPWAFPTMGGAGGQTIVGAISTGTHGGDFTLPPIADAVLAVHLVADGGKHYWIESVDDRFTPQLTEDARLKAVYGQDRYGGPDNFQIIRENDNDVFNAVLVSAGRFGVIYSVVLRAVGQYLLHEERHLSDWATVKAQLQDQKNRPLFARPGPQGAEARFLQVALCLTPYNNFGSHLAGVTKRWNVPLTADPPGRLERVGPVSEVFDARLQSPAFANAGNTHPFKPDPNNPDKAAPPSFLERACANASFLVGVLEATIDEIQEFLDSDGVLIGVGIAEIAAPGAGGLLALARGLLELLGLLRDLLREDHRHDRLGQYMETLKDLLLNREGATPENRAAGIFVWQLIGYKAFMMLQDDMLPGYEAISYAVMDNHDYLNTSCEVNVESVEVFFDATDTKLTAFIDALMAFEMAQEFQGKTFVGYASMRFVGRTQALIGMERHPVTCAVEVAGLKDVSGSQELVDYAVTLALQPDIGGVLHWGQRNDSSAADIERQFGADLDRWRAALARITDGGRLDGFSNRFSRQAGLEVI